MIVFTLTFHCKNWASPIHPLRHHNNAHMWNDEMEQCFLRTEPEHHNKSSPEMKRILLFTYRSLCNGILTSVFNSVSGYNALPVNHFDP